MGVKDIFDTEPKDTDQDLGNDFIDLDDPNGNGDFSEQENNVANAGVDMEEGTIDHNTEPDTDYSGYAGFNDLDVMEEDITDTDDFLTGDEVFQQQNTTTSNEPEGKEDGGSQNNQENDFLDSINKKYNTSFKTEKEFNDFLKKTNESESQQEQSVVSAKEQEQYEINKGNISYLDSILKMDDADLVKEHEIIKFHQKNKSKPTEEDLSEIDEKIERMELSATLGLNADNIRLKFDQQKTNFENFNNGIDSKLTQAQQAKQKQNQQKLLENYRDIFVSNEGVFMGVPISKEDLQASYNDAKSGDFVKRMMDNPKLLASLSLIERKMKEIQKVTSQPGYSDGIDAILNNNTNGKRMGSNARQSQASSSNKAKSRDEKFLM
tara:strand:- start:64859 stop:65995 length:1137 start_codon:yes stop_codon:yes gene_type:complete